MICPPTLGRDSAKNAAICGGEGNGTVVGLSGKLVHPADAGSVLAPNMSYYYHHAPTLGSTSYLSICNVDFSGLKSILTTWR